MERAGTEKGQEDGWGEEGRGVRYGWSRVLSPLYVFRGSSVILEDCAIDREIMLNRSGVSGHPCLIPGCGGNGFIFPQ
jgi:hypothetical protein